MSYSRFGNRNDKRNPLVILSLSLVVMPNSRILSPSASLFTDVSKMIEAEEESDSIQANKEGERDSGKNHFLHRTEDLHPKQCNHDREQTQFSLEDTGRRGMFLREGGGKGQIYRPFSLDGNKSQEGFMSDES